MMRLLFIIALALAVVTLFAVAVGALVQAAEGTARVGRTTFRRIERGLDRGNPMQKIAFVALILLLVGLTSGLIGGL